MKSFPFRFSFPFPSLRKPLPSVLTAAALIAGCGGGGGVDTGGSGISTAFSSGRISGFGSIIVNGIRFTIPHPKSSTTTAWSTCAATSNWAWSPTCSRAQ